MTLLDPLSATAGAAAPGTDSPAAADGRKPSAFAASLAPQRAQRLRRPAFATFEEERQYRKERLAAGFRIFAKRNFVDHVAGHITVRDPELPDHFWVNPNGRAFSQIRASDLILVDREGTVVSGNGTVGRAAFVIHSEIHAARPDVVAAAHSHSIYTRVLAVLHQELLPISQDSLMFFEDNVVIPEFTGVVQDRAQAVAIARALGDKRAAILGNHGLLTVGDSVEEAVNLYVNAERCAEVQVLAQAAGTMTLIDEDIARRTHDGAKHGGSDFVWYGFQPLWEEIVAEQPDLLD